jgi:flagellar basal-body rod modification protein FlgD
VKPIASISTSNVWPNYSSSNTSGSTAKSSSELGKDEFLKILVTQLQNQDPMQPMEDKEFISQMAQFSSLEQTMNVATQLEALRHSPGMVAMALGMNVTWIETDSSGTSTTKSGIVDSVVTRDGVPYVKIGTAEVKMDDLTSISLPTQASGTDTGGDSSE